MSLFSRIIAGVFRPEPEPKDPQRERELVEAIATELSKKELKFSDADIKRIAHTVVDSDRDIDRLAARIIKSRSFWIPFVLGLIVSGVVGFATIWIRISSKVDDQLGQLQTNVQVKLESAYKEVTNNIALKFQEKQFAEIVSSAVSTEATNQFAKQIAPDVQKFADKLTNAFNGLQTIQASLSNSFINLQTNMNTLQLEARTSIAELKDTAEFYMLVMKAHAFERDAFFKLDRFTGRDNLSRKPLADSSVVNIELAVLTQQALLSVGVADPWVGTGLTETTASYQQFTNQYWVRAPIPRCISLIRQFNAQERFSVEDRLSFLIEIIKTTKNLLILQTACQMLESHAHLGKEGRSFILFQEYLDWYDKRIQNKQKE
jgi:hypothetical protein